MIVVTKGKKLDGVHNKIQVILILSALFAKGLIMNQRIVVLDVQNAEFLIILNEIVGIKIKKETKQILHMRVKKSTCFIHA